MGRSREGAPGLILHTEPPVPPTTHFACFCSHPFPVFLHVERTHDGLAEAA